MSLCTRALNANKNSLEEDKCFYNDLLLKELTVKLFREIQNIAPTETSKHSDMGKEILVNYLDDPVDDHKISTLNIKYVTSVNILYWKMIIFPLLARNDNFCDVHIFFVLLCLSPELAN